MPSHPELPAALLDPERPILCHQTGARRFVYEIEFFGVDVGQLLEDEPERLGLRLDGPRDPRLRRAIEAAAEGWISDRAGLVH